MAEEMSVNGYRVRYNDNKIICCPEGGMVDKEEVEQELNQMKEGASEEFSKRPPGERYRFAYEYLKRKYADMARANGQTPNMTEIEKFAGQIVEKVYQEYCHTGRG